jgi:hypothetical protein
MAYTTINKSTDYFNTKLYTGTGSTASISGVGFQPDFSWIKVRNNTDNHVIFDAVRGATKRLEPNATDAEATISNELTAFNSDGFSIGGADRVNRNNDTYASWNLKANGSGSANTAGSINSTVSANTTSGFSIVSYSGTGSLGTVGHGLGVKPKMIIVRKRNSAENWLVYNEKLTASNYLLLNGAGASGADNMWNSTEPTSSVFTVNAVAGANGSGGTYIAYCFNDVQGFSKFGSYVGNESTNGTFVYLGFKPSFILFKKTTGSAGDWQLWDNKRDPINPVEKAIHPNANGGASADQDIDFLSNGFKLRSNQSHLNADGVVFIYMAFAEAPLVGTNGVTAKAR